MNPHTVESCGISLKRPRLGFMGIGWIGRNRLEVLARNNLAEISAICDPVLELAQNTAKSYSAKVCDSLESLLQEDLDGIVIATPSAYHASHSLHALNAGCAVFCQKPLGRYYQEHEDVINAARCHNRLLAVDLSYRHTRSMQIVHELIHTGAIGDIYASNLVFHNAYGPDKDWYYDRSHSGGGCIIDLAIHLIDLALWCLNYPRIESVTSQLFYKGYPVDPRSRAVEDYATALIKTGNTAISLACSWHLPAGGDALIEASFYGTRGGLSFHNINGSFYDFVAERFHGTKREILSEPPDEWSGRAATAWARQLALSHAYNNDVESILPAARLVDALYHRNE